MTIRKKKDKRVYRIKTVELWTTTAFYVVHAESPEDALRLVQSGTAPAEEHEHTGDADEIVDILSVESVEAVRVPKNPRSARIPAEDKEAV